MNASGLTLALLGVVAIAQVLKGGALQRLGIIGCPATSSPSKGGGGNSNGNNNSPGTLPQLPPRFSG